MNVPFVKVNNQQEFDRVVDKMKKETGLKSHHSTNGYDSVFSALGVYNYEGEDWIFMLNPNHYENKHLKIISADEYLTGVIENFTLDDLEETMIVELRNKDRLIYFDGVLSTFIWSGGTFVTSNIHMKLNRTNDDFTDKDNEKFDIMKIYKPKSCTNINMNLLKSDSNLVLIFDAETHRRNKYKISQRKSEIENEIKKLQEELKSLEAK